MIQTCCAAGSAALPPLPRRRALSAKLAALRRNSTRSASSTPHGQHAVYKAKAIERGQNQSWLSNQHVALENTSERIEKTVYSLRQKADLVESSARSCSEPGELLLTARAALSLQKVDSQMERRNKRFGAARAAEDCEPAPNLLRFGLWAESKLNRRTAREHCYPAKRTPRGTAQLLNRSASCEPGAPGSECQARGQLSSARSHSRASFPALCNALGTTRGQRCNQTTDYSHFYYYRAIPLIRVRAPEAPIAYLFYDACLLNFGLGRAGSL
jgi:hypothetical protein